MCLLLCHFIIQSGKACKSAAQVPVLEKVSSGRDKAFSVFRGGVSVPTFNHNAPGNKLPGTLLAGLFVQCGCLLSQLLFLALQTEHFFRKSFTKRSGGRRAVGSCLIVFIHRNLLCICWLRRYVGSKSVAALSGVLDASSG